MLRGAQGVLAQVQATTEVVEVAGAYELPAALAMALASPRRWDGFLLLGCDGVFGALGADGAAALAAEQLLRRGAG